MDIKLAIYTAAATLILCNLVSAQYDLFANITPAHQTDPFEWHTEGDSPDSLWTSNRY